MKDRVEKDLVFIASPGRTGTKFLGEKLAEMVDDAFSVHEPDITSGFDRRTLRGLRWFGVHHMVLGRLLGRTGARLLSYRYLKGELTHEAAVRRVRRSRDRFIESRPQHLFIEANLQWSLLLPVLRDAYPRAKIAAILRRQESWVSSCLRRGGRYDAGDRVKRGRIDPVALGLEAAPGRWAQLPVAEKLRWEWELVAEKLEGFAAADDRTRLFWYEDLFTSPDRAANFSDFLDFVATHGDRRYPTHLDPAMLEQRLNAS